MLCLCVCVDVSYFHNVSHFHFMFHNVSYFQTYLKKYSRSNLRNLSTNRWYSLRSSLCWNIFRTQNLGALRVLFGKLLFRILLFLRITSCISISSSSSSELLSLYILSQPFVNSKGRKKNTCYNFKPTWFLVEAMNI